MLITAREQLRTSQHFTSMHNCMDTTAASYFQLLLLIHSSHAPRAPWRIISTLQAAVVVYSTPHLRWKEQQVSGANGGASYDCKGVQDMTHVFARLLAQSSDHVYVRELVDTHAHVLIHAPIC